MGHTKAEAQGPKSVLIANPNRQLCAVIRGLLLEMWASETVFATDSHKARKYLEAQKPDLILCSDDLPPLGGPEFVGYVRRVIVEVQEIPIIMMIARPSTENVTKARDAGVDQVLGLPITGDALSKRWACIAQDRPPFVVASSYVGPCRRKITAEWYVGPERRKKDNTEPVA